MKFTIQRDALLKPLQMVAGAVERRQTLPILSNVKVSVTSHQVALTGTDLEIELTAQATLAEPAEGGVITLPAHKLIDICRSLPSDAQLEFKIDEKKANLRAGKSRFTLACLPATEFPSIDDAPGEYEFNINRDEFRYLIDKTSFSMAQNDVRYYLNGLLLLLDKESIRCVATDGHRLALCTLSQSTGQHKQVIIPRKGVSELARLLGDLDDELAVTLMANHIRVTSSQFSYTSKLIDGQYPDYTRVIPKGGKLIATMDRDALKNMLSRVAVLSNEKYRGVRLELTSSLMRVLANNPEQEEAEDELEIHYEGEDFSVAFNVSYLLDILNHLPTGEVRFIFTDPNSSLLIESAQDEPSCFVAMPMRL